MKKEMHKVPDQITLVFAFYGVSSRSMKLMNDEWFEPYRKCVTPRFSQVRPLSGPASHAF
jgi:homoserine kinase